MQFDVAIVGAGLVGQGRAVAQNFNHTSVQPSPYIPKIAKSRGWESSSHPMAVD